MVEMIQCTFITFLKLDFYSHLGNRSINFPFQSFFIPTSKLQSLVDFFIPSLFPILSFIKGKYVNRFLPDVPWNFFWGSKWDKVSVDLKPLEKFRILKTSTLIKYKVFIPLNYSNSVLNCHSVSPLPPQLRHQVVSILIL